MVLVRRLSTPLHRCPRNHRHRTHNNPEALQPPTRTHNNPEALQPTQINLQRLHDEDQPVSTVTKRNRHGAGEPFQYGHSILIALELCSVAQHGNASQRQPGGIRSAVCGVCKKGSHTTPGVTVVTDGNSNVVAGTSKTSTTVLSPAISPKLWVATFYFIFVAVLRSTLNSTDAKRGFIGAK